MAIPNLCATAGTSLKVPAAMIRRAFAEYANAEKIVLDLNAGRVPVVFPPSQNTGGSNYGEMTQPEPVFGPLHAVSALAPLLGLREDDCTLNPQPQSVSTGLPFCVVLLKSIDALARLRVDLRASEEYFQSSEAKFFYAIAPESANVWRARMQFYNGEDPATGSAAGCAIAYLAQHGIVPSGQRIHIRQGVEIYRPSDLYGSAKSHFGKITEVRLGGSTVQVAKGRLFLQ